MIGRPGPRLLGVLTVIGLVTVTALTFSGIYREPFQGPSRTVKAAFDRAAQLYPGDQVRIRGDIDGKVTSVDRDAEQQQAMVTMQLDHDAGELYADAHARLRIKTLLAGSFYIQLDRGTPGAGMLEGMIPRSRTDEQVELEDITDIFRAGAMRGFQTLPRETAKAFSAPGAIARDIKITGDIAADGATATQALRGRLPGRDLPRLVRSAALAVQALQSPTDDLRTLVSGAAATARVTGARQAEIRSTISSLPSVTSDLTSTLRRLDGTLETADHLVNTLLPAAPDVAPTLADLKPAVEQTGQLLDRAHPLLRTLPSLVRTLGTVSRSGASLVDRLRPALRKLDQTILPYMGREDPETGYSTTVMIGGTTAGFGGSSDQMDANGHFIRFPASISTDSVYLPCKSSLVDPTAAFLLKCDGLNDAISTYLNHMPTRSGASK